MSTSLIYKRPKSSIRASLNSNIGRNAPQKTKKPSNITMKFMFLINFATYQFFPNLKELM